MAVLNGSDSSLRSPRVLTWGTHGAVALAVVGAAALAGIVYEHGVRLAGIEAALAERAASAAPLSGLRHGTVTDVPDSVRSI